MVGALADVNPVSIAAGEFDNFGGDEVVVKHDIGLLHQPQGAEGEQVRVAGSPSDQIHRSNGWGIVGGEGGALVGAHVARQVAVPVEADPGLQGFANALIVDKMYARGTGAECPAQRGSGTHHATASNTVRLPGFARVDLAAYYALSEQMSVQLNIENLLDERYYPSAHGNSNIQPGEPLNGSLSVRFAF